MSVYITNIGDKTEVRGINEDEHLLRLRLEAETKIEEIMDGLSKELGELIKPQITYNWKARAAGDKSCVSLIFNVTPKIVETTSRYVKEAF